MRTGLLAVTPPASQTLQTVPLALAVDVTEGTTQYLAPPAWAGELREMARMNMWGQMSFCRRNALTMVFVIDPTLYGNAARFMNASCDPTVRPTAFTAARWAPGLANAPRVLFVATRDIAATLHHLKAVLKRQGAVGLCERAARRLAQSRRRAVGRVRG